MVNKEPDELLTEEHFISIGSYINAAADAGVSTIINVGTSLQESYNSLALAQRFPSVYATIGLHPCDANDGWREALDQFKKIMREYTSDDLRNEKLVGIGETGLDFYHKPYNRVYQEDAFKAQIELALAYNKALVIHVREAGDEVLKIIEPYHKDGLRAVIHCFSQKQDFADIVTGWGLCVGIDGPITYPKNQWLRDIVATLNEDALVLETDAPFLPPQVYRGKQNSPAYLPLFASTVAECMGKTLEETAVLSSRNACRLFGIRLESR